MTYENAVACEIQKFSVTAVISHVARKQSECELILSLRTSLLRWRHSAGENIERPLWICTDLEL